MFENLKKVFGIKTKSIGFYSRQEVRDLFNSDFNEEANISHYINEGYGKNPYVNQVINKIAKTIGRLPLLYNNSEVETLLEKPNKNMYQNDFFEALTTLLLTGGNAFGYSENYFMGVPDNVKVLNTQDLDPYFDGEGEFIYAIYNNGEGRQTKILPNELIHIKFPNILDNGDAQWFGTSPLRALQQTYNASNEVINAQAHLFKNKGAIGFITSSDSMMPLTPTERNQIDNQFRDNRAGGSDRYGKILSTSTPVTYTEVGKSPKDLMLDEAGVSFLRLIMLAYGVGIYQFKFDKTIIGANQIDYSIKYYLLPFTNQNADRTTRIEWTQNGSIRNSIFDLTGLNWYQQFRFNGKFWKETPTLEVDNYVNQDYEIEQIQDKLTFEYELNIDPIPKEIGEPIINDSLLANTVKITDYNLDAYKNYINFEVQPTAVEGADEWGQI